MALRKKSVLTKEYMTYIDTILEDFQKSFTPQEISVAENIFSRLVAGETIWQIAQDCVKYEIECEHAIRFFILKTRRNKRAVKLYNEMQEARFK